MAEENTKKKIQITVAGSQFTVVSAEDEGYTAGIAGNVDNSIIEMCRNGRVSVTAAAILTAVNYCDDLNKANRDIEELKKQLQEYLQKLTEENNKKEELLKEIARLKEDVEIYRRRLIRESPGINEDEPISPAVKPVRRSVSVSESQEAAEDADVRLSF